MSVSHHERPHSGRARDERGRSVWRLVSGFPAAKRERRALAMLMPQAYIDESGNEPTKPHCVLAGFPRPPRVGPLSLTNGKRR